MGIKVKKDFVEVNNTKKDKKEYVYEMFFKYSIKNMIFFNDVISFGMHRYWKKLSC
ncbi:MAG: hypothetical protein KatS3mg068_0787 [Candidatus Sericytochromatia bacterium]|nr:MAG: hypothetical protein KatS3mg068_0787 [Candidatus Sericytochromatia bacterium]